jgi:hypothetical protein
MRILGKKEKENAVISPEVRRGDPGELKEFINREFRTVKNGLDPDQVIHFMESVLGSTEAALKRMEHLAALQKSTQDMELMITEARLLSERIKAQSEMDGRTEKEKIIAEGRRQAAEAVEKGERQSLELIEQTRKTCTASIEGVRAYLTQARQKMELLLERTEKSCGETLNNTSALVQDVIGKAREMEQQAFQKARERAEADLAALKKDIGASVEETRGGLSSLGDQFAGLRPEETAPPVVAHPEVAPRAVTAAVEAGTPAAALVEATAELVLEKAEASAGKEPSPVIRNTAPNLCSGRAILFIPKEAGPDWIKDLRQRLLGVPGLNIRMELGNLTGGETMIIDSSELVDLSSILLGMPGVADVEEQNGQESREPGRKPGLDALPPPGSRTLTVLLGNRNN